MNDKNDEKEEQDNRLSGSNELFNKSSWKQHKKLS